MGSAVACEAPPALPQMDAARPAHQLCMRALWPANRYWRIKSDGCAHMVLFFQEGEEG